MPDEIIRESENYAPMWLIYQIALDYFFMGAVF